MYKNDSLMDENQIIAYLNGQLSPEEELAFEAQMNANPALKKEVSTHESIIKALRHKEYNNFLSKVKAFEKTLPRIEEKEEAVSVINAEPTEKPGIIRRLVPWIAVAASIVLIFFAGNYFLSNDAEVIYTQAYQEAEYIKLQSNDEEVRNYNVGIDHFADGEYNQAITLFSSISDTSSLYLNAQYLLSHCYFKNKDYKKALQYLQKVEGKKAQITLLTTENEEYRKIDKQDVEWNKMLFLGGARQNNAAKKLLEKMVVDKNHYYHNKATLLKSKL